MTTDSVERQINLQPRELFSISQENSVNQKNYIKKFWTVTIIFWWLQISCVKKCKKVHYKATSAKFEEKLTHAETS